MKAIILAGGFATRLKPISEICPKPLLPIVGKPIIQYIIEKVEEIEEVDEIFVTTNDRFKKHFKNWLGHFSSSKKIKLIIEETKREEEKLGAIGALGALAKKENIDEDIIVVAGDNLFDFSLVDFVNDANNRKASLVAFYDIESYELAKRFGVTTLSNSKRILEFVEKPEEPKSTLISTCCYFIKKEDLALMHRYLDDKNNPDKPGYFVKWLSEKKPVYGFTFSGKWFDIGQMDAYKAANEEYESRISHP